MTALSGMVGDEGPATSVDGLVENIVVAPPYPFSNPPFVLGLGRLCCIKPWTTSE